MNNIQATNEDKKAATPKTDANILLCPSCSHENRPIAKFCCLCGKSMPDITEAPQPSTVEQPVAMQEREQPTTTGVEPAAKKPAPPPIPMGDYIGLENVRADLGRIKKHIGIQQERAKHGIKITPKISIFIFRGDTGTGKTLVASSFIKELKKANCLASDKVTAISARALSRQHKDEFALANFLGETKPAALIIDDATGESEFLHELLLALSKTELNCVCVLTALREPFEEFFKNYPEDKQRVTKFFDFPNPTTDELSIILEKLLKEKGYHFDTDLRESFAAYIEERRHDPACEHKNGWLIKEDIILSIEKNQGERLEQMESLSTSDYTRIDAEDIPLKNKKRTVNEILAELDSMIGLTAVKKAVRTIAQTIEMQKERDAKGLKSQGQAIHIVFTGNPGTGKTTVARRLGQLFRTMGLLPSDKFIEKDRSGLVGQYVGSTAPLVNQVCTDAIGGILLIDEAYTLSGGKDGKADTFGQEAIDTLLKRMEDDRGKFVVIAAGYKDEMEGFIQSNPGLKSRFTHFLHLDDYMPDELYAIFASMAKQNGYVLSEDAQMVAQEAIEELHRNRGKDFANARTARNLFDTTVRKMGSRLATLSSEERTEETLALITAEDIPYEKKKVLSVGEILAELDAMIGLTAVKKAVRELAQTIEMQKEREAKGLQSKGQAIHIVFTGNPGTGKTTVARKLGELFKVMQLLPNSKIVEVDRSKMVAAYVGQTAPQVNKICDDAMGGILLIDEAYTLSGGKDGNADTFGQEAIDALLKRMEDDRGKFVVIAAGYKDEMEGFIQSNPGLKSRFTHFIHLDDYLPNELYAIFTSMTKQNGYVLSEDAQAVAQEAIEELYKNRGKDFANARTARNLFDTTVRKMGSRLATLSSEERTEEVLTLIAAEDIPYEKKKVLSVGEILAELDSMIGLTAVKKAVRELAQAIMIEKEKEEQGLKSQGQAIHIVFTGNPGTGKTTVARKLGALFNAMQMLPSSKIVEVDRGKLVASYVGQTAPQVNQVCDDAMGGILFVDEAYTLSGEQGRADTFGQEAIDTLLKRMEDDRGKFVLIAAGYKNEMEWFIQSNPGLKSRFTHFLHLDDYMPDELYAIFASMTKQNGYTLTDDAQEIAKVLISDIYKNRGRDFANARTVRNFLDDIKRRQASRIAVMEKEERAKVLTLITAQDFPQYKEGEE